MNTPWMAAPLLVALASCGPSRTEGPGANDRPDDGFGSPDIPGARDMLTPPDGNSETETPERITPVAASPQHSSAPDTPPQLPGALPTTRPLPPGSVTPPGGTVPLSPPAGPAEPKR